MDRELYADVVEEHAIEAAFLWVRRDLAAVAPHYDRVELAAVDERLEAHLDGLRIGAELGRKSCVDAIAPDEPGAVFALLVLAAEANDAERVALALEAAVSSRDAGRAAVSALAWLPFATARPVIAPLLAGSAGAPRLRLGIAACAAHREDPGDALGYALYDDDPALRARALRAVRELGRSSELSAVRSAIGASDPAVAYWAAWSAALFGEASAGEALWSLASGGHRHAPDAAAMAARITPVREARERLEAWTAIPERRRLAATTAGVLGDPALGPWLVDAARTPSLARVAAEALAAMTGARIEGELSGAAPAGFRAGPTDDAADADVALDPDWQLPWPSPEGLARFWQGAESRFRRGVRFVAGEPLGAPALERELTNAGQRRRIRAALELGLLSPQKPLVEVRAREAVRAAR